MFALRQQPIKGLYLTYELLSTTFFRLPIWFLCAIPPSWRGRRSWSIKRVIWVKLIRHLTQISNRTGPIQIIPNHFAITPGIDVNGVWIEPATHLVTGDLKIWASVAGVSAIRIPGYWLHKPNSTIETGASPMPGEKVVLAFHGGAYIRQSAHPSDITANIARGFLDFVEPVHRVFSVEYRLSNTTPYESVNPFPAALLDALSGYNYLVNVVGFAPEDIIVEGDSAGGNLALALTRYLVETRNASNLSLPSPPGGLVLTSPWADLSGSHATPGSSGFEFAKSDYIGGKDMTAMDFSVNAFVGPFGRGAAHINRYISPASLSPQMQVNFKDFPRTFIVVGGAETLLDQVTTLKKRMIKDLGEGRGVKDGEGKVTFYEGKDSVHDFLAFPFQEPERSEAFKEIGAWVVAT